MSLAFVLPLAVLTGCAGSVKVSDQDAFGGVSSASWVHMNYKDTDDNDGIELVNVGGLCGKTQDYWDAYNELDKAVNDADVTSSSFCKDIKDALLAYTQAGDAIIHDGVHVVALSTAKGGSSVPEADTYDVGGETKGLYGSVTYYDKDPFADATDDFDEDAQGNDGCGVDFAGLFTDSPGDTWTLDDGSLEITTLTDEKSLKGSLDASMVDDDGDDAGDITATFTASYCDVDAG